MGYTSTTPREDITADFRLSHLLIQNKLPASATYQTIQRAVLEHAYVQDSLATTKRLRLDKVRMTGADSVTVNDYQFFYNPRKLAPPFSGAKDFWGYYNGVHLNDQNSKRLPPISISYNSGGGSGTTTIGSANRQPDTVAVQAQILTKIVFPTGGYTTFEYESNRYQNNNATQIAGGLRIKKMTSFGGNNTPPVVKTYQYGAGRSNANTLNSNWINSEFAFRAVDYTYRYYAVSGTLCMGKTLGEGNYHIRIFSSNPVIATVGLENAPVFYANVTEYLGTSTANNGYTTYQFKDFADNYAVGGIPIQGTGPGRMDNYAWRRGQLLQKSVFDQAGTIRAKTENLYQSIVLQSRDTIGLLVYRKFENDYCNFNLTPPCEYSAVNAQQYFPSYYSLKTGIEKLIETRHYTYSSGASPTFKIDTVKYEYDSTYFQLRSTYRTNRGIGYLSRLDYPYHRNSAPYTQMIGRNIVGLPVEQVSYHQNGASWSEINRQKTTFSMLKPTGAADSMFLPTQIETSEMGNSLELAATMSYDKRGNITQSQGRDAIPQTLLWGYDLVYPVASIQGATVAQSNTALGIVTADDAAFQAQTGTALMATLETLRNNLRGSIAGVKVKSYAHLPHIGVSIEADPTGKHVFYEYDAFSRLQKIRNDAANGPVVKSFCYNFAGYPVTCESTDPNSFITPPATFLLADTSPKLSVEPDTLLFSPAAGQKTFVVAVLQDSLSTNWNVELPNPIPNWLTVSPLTGRNGTKTVTVTVTKTTDTTQRVAVLKVKSLELDTVIQVRIMQRGLCKLPKPNLVAPDTVLCAADSVLLSVTNTCANGTKLRWSTGDSVVTSLYVKTAGKYWVICHSDTCRSDTSFVTVTRRTDLQAPQIVTQGAIPICTGQSLTLLADGCPMGATSRWGTGQTTTSINVTTAGIYSVRCLIAPNCLTDSATFTVTATVVPTPTIQGPTSVCQGQNVTLTANGCTSATEWRVNGSLFSTTVGNQIVTQLTQNSTFTAKCKVGLCVGVASTNHAVNVNTRPAVQITASQSAVCAGSSFTLTATATGTIAWSGPNGFSSSQSSVTITNANLSKSGLYRAISSLGGCVGSDSVQIAVLDSTLKPQITIPTPFACIMDECTNYLQLKAEPALQGNAYQWYKNGTPIAGEQSATLFLELDKCTPPNDTSTRWLGTYQVRLLSSTPNACQSALSSPHYLLRRPDSSFVVTNNVTRIEFTSGANAGIRAYSCDTLVWAQLSTTQYVQIQPLANQSFYYVVEADCDHQATFVLPYKPPTVVASNDTATCDEPVILKTNGCGIQSQKTWYLKNGEDYAYLGVIDSLVVSPPLTSGNYVVVCSIAYECFTDFSTPLFITVDTTQTCSDCPVGQAVGQSFAQLAPNPDIGFYNPQDSVYYRKRIVRWEYTGFKENGVCKQVLKATGYAEPLTVRLFVKWEGPNGSNTLSTYRAVLRLAQPNTLGQNGYAHEHEIAYNLKNNTHIHLNKFLPYDVLLFKAVPDGWTNGNFGPDPNALAKCFEVSLSNTTTFDTSYVIGENSNAAMWKRHALDMNTLLSSGRRFIVVREKDCIICPTAPNISIITAQSNLVICNPNDLVTLRIDTTNLPNCINTIGEKGPFQWGKVGSNGQLQRLNANDLYRCHGQYGFNFFAQGAGTYWIRLGHEWWCWPNTETRFEVTVNCASIQTATDRQNRTER